MVMWFNVKEARTQLLENGFVYSLRPKPYRLRGKRVKGFDVLMYDGFGKKGKVYYEFVKRIRDNSELKEFVEHSGFKSIESWIVRAKDNRCLYFVMLIEKNRKSGSKPQKQIVFGAIPENKTKPEVVT